MLAANCSKFLNAMALSVGMLLIHPTTSFAIAIPSTTITFNDATDSLSITTSSTPNGPVTSNPTCDNTTETCSINFSFPSTSGASIGLPVWVVEPNSSIISDKLDASFNVFTGLYTATFQSDVDETNGLGTYVSGTKIVEDGTIQDAFSIHFSATTDFPGGADVFIRFQSDLDATTTTGVPEPMSLALFGAGLIGLGALRRRSKARA